MAALPSGIPAAPCFVSSVILHGSCPTIQVTDENVRQHWPMYQPVKNISCHWLPLAKLDFKSNDPSCLTASQTANPLILSYLP